MKKVMILALAAVGLGLFSCKKDYKCECTVAYSTSGSSTVTKDLKATNKKAANAACSNYTEVEDDQSYSASGTVVFTQKVTKTATCTLK